MRFVLLAALAVAGAAVPLYAQPPPEKIGRFVADIRGAFARHKEDPSVANDLKVLTANMPAHSLGLVFGAHWYPGRAGRVTFGLGGEIVLARGSKTLDPITTTGTTTTAPTAVLPVVRRHFSASSPQLSLNFGGRDGWSYISGGIGLGKLYADREDRPATGVANRKAINYGAGARWFTHHRHLAVSLDVRWYSVKAALATPTSIATPQTTLLLLTGGIAVR